MTPERWAQIEDLFHRAAECGPEQRTALLDQSCSDDPELRHEVEALLSCDGSARDNIQAAMRPAIEGLGFALTGEVISHYRIMDGVGSGGMGLVYRAEDVRLGRLVALKSLPEELANNPLALARFEREARSVSAVEHPNICPIYEFGEHEGRSFLVMQLLEGQTLRKLLENRRSEESKPGVGTAAQRNVGLPLDQVLDLAIQIADGLQAAHQKGIIHRDIKPANIFVTNEGHLKILDFGLAKLAQDVAISDDDLAANAEGVGERVRNGDPVLSRTGVAIGTAAYMSPEQVRGERLDARTDLFSFGLVLYEMATGNMAFHGESSGEIRSAILRDQPVSLSQLNPRVPPELETVILRALEKDRNLRYQHALDIRAELERLRRDSDSGRHVAARSSHQSVVAHELKTSPELPRDKRLLAAGFVAVAIGVLVAGFLFLRIGKSYRASPDVGQWVAERRVTANPPETPVRDAVVSPDGKYIAYADTTGLYLHQISTGDTHPWPLPKGFVAWPDSWFPDGTHLLAVRLEGEGRKPGEDWKPSLWKLSLLGGPPQKIMDEAAGGSVSPDGTRIVYVPAPEGHSYSNELRVMDSDGENVRTVAYANSRDQSWIYPEVWSPGGQRVAYIERHLIAAPRSGDRPAISIRTSNADGSASTVVLDDPRIGPALWWVPDGRILYAYREDPAAEGNNYGVYSIQVDERTGRAIGQPRQITNAEGFVSGMSASSDGRRLVLWRENESWQPFITELNPISRQWTTPRRLTLDTNDNVAGAWTADGKAVLFVSYRNGMWKLFKQNTDETIPEVLVEGRSIDLPRSSPDGSQVLYLAGSKPGDTSFPASLMSKPLAGGSARLVLQERGIINYECARAPSKLCVFSKLVGPDLIFVSCDLEHGAGSELARTAGLDFGSTSGYTKWGLSPDGSRLAVVMDRHRIRFLALDTGLAHDVSVNDWPLFDAAWSADSKSLFMLSRTSKGAAAILEVNEAGKVEVAIEGKANSDFLFFIQSPDRRHGILEMITPGDNNAWMVDNF